MLILRRTLEPSSRSNGFYGHWAELNKEMLRHSFEVNNAGSRTRGKKFSEICEEKKGLHLKPRHFVVVEGIFQFFKEKIVRKYF